LYAARPAFRILMWRVNALTLDVTTNAAQNSDACSINQALDILINMKAGVTFIEDLTNAGRQPRNGTRETFCRDLRLSQLLPPLGSFSGVRCHVLSLAALAIVPFPPAYTISRQRRFR